MVGLIVLGILAAVVMLLIVANSRWVARRGWVFNRHNPRPGGSANLMLLDQIYQPGVEHVIEEQSSESIRAEQDESGGKPISG